MASFVEVEKDRGLRAVLFDAGDFSFEDIVVLSGLGLRSIGPGDAEKVTKFGEEELSRTAFVTAGGFPFVDEFG